MGAYGMGAGGDTLGDCSLAVQHDFCVFIIFSYRENRGVFTKTLIKLAKEVCQKVPSQRSLAIQ